MNQPKKQKQKKNKPTQQKLIIIALIGLMGDQMKSHTHRWISGSLKKSDSSPRNLPSFVLGVSLLNTDHRGESRIRYDEVEWVQLCFLTGGESGEKIPTLSSTRDGAVASLMNRLIWLVKLLALMLWSCCSHPTVSATTVSAHFLTVSVFFYKYIHNPDTRNPWRKFFFFLRSKKSCLSVLILNGCNTALTLLLPADLLELRFGNRSRTGVLNEK